MTLISSSLLYRHCVGLQKFLAQEKALGNLPVKPDDKVYKETTLYEYLVTVLNERPIEEIERLAAELRKCAADPASPSRELKWTKKRYKS